MPTSPTPAFVKLLLQRARQDWQTGRTPDACFVDLCAMIRNQLQADQANELDGAVTDGTPPRREAGKAPSQEA